MTAKLKSNITDNAPVPDMKLFYTCFIALVTTAFGFILRALVLPQWGYTFNLTQTQLGEIAGVGLYIMSSSAGIMILVAATVYGLGKSFFWPTMLGMVSERFPKGGALTLNITGGLGMIAAGVIGAGILGFIQDKSVDQKITAYDSKHNTAIHSTYITEQKTSFFGDYKALDQTKLAKADASQQLTVTTIRDAAKKEALRYITIFPLIMLISFLLLLVYFRSKGGYKVVLLNRPKEPESTPY